MKQLLKSITVILLLLPFYSFSQEGLIEINNTSINVPETYDFGEVTGSSYTKYVIKNNRNSTIMVSDISTPAGFFANISENKISAGKKVILYVGLDTNFIDKEGAFENKIIIKTNLIMNIEIPIKGTVKK